MMTDSERAFPFRQIRSSPQLVFSSSHRFLFFFASLFFFLSCCIHPNASSISIGSSFCRIIFHCLHHLQFLGLFVVLFDKLINGCSVCFGIDVDILPKIFHFFRRCDRCKLWIQFAFLCFCGWFEIQELGFRIVHLSNQA